MKRRHRARTPVAVVAVLGASLVLGSIILQLCMGPMYLAQRHMIRHEMRSRMLSGLPQSALTVFRFSAEQFEQAEFADGGKELRVERVMYDIVRIYREADGPWVIEAARDDKETRLGEQLDRMVRDRVTAAERGQEERSLIIAAWACFCEPWIEVRTPVPSSRSLAFRETPAALGCGAGAIDPGPPRSA